MPPRRTLAGGAKKRPTRYRPGECDDSIALAAALRAHRKGDGATALARYREALDGAPDCLDAWLNLGTLCVALGRAREAASAFSRAIDVAPNDPRARRDVAIGLSAIGRFEESRAHYERCLALDPGLIGARLGISRVCAELGDHANAIAHATRAVDDAPAQVSTLLELHRAVFDDSNPAPSIAAARAAHTIDTQDVITRYFLAAASALQQGPAEIDALLGSDDLVPLALRDALHYLFERDAPRPRVFATRAQTLRYALEQAHLPGPVLEFGVRHGISTRILARHAPGTLHAFDVFTGLPERWQGRDAGAFGTNSEVPELPPTVQIHVGLFADTLPEFLERHDVIPGLVHIDSDLYSSARTVLYGLGERIRPGCVLVFDEYVGHASWRDDEFRAFHEAVAHFGWRYEELSLSWMTGQGVVRLRD